MPNITIKSIEKPLKQDSEEDLNWICKSLGFSSLRDTEETSAKIFKAVIEATKKGKILNSNEIAEKAMITRGTAVYHLNEYISSGLIIKTNKRYTLRTRSIKNTLEEMELDILRTLKDIKKIAEEIDKELGLKER